LTPPGARYYGGMRLLLVVGIAALLGGCAEKNEPAPRARKPVVTKATVSGSLELPNEDGRVYIIDSPTMLSIDHVTCFLHVKQGSSTMACSPPRIELPGSASSEP
jgi:hypothetical protein